MLRRNLELTARKFASVSGEGLGVTQGKVGANADGVIGPETVRKTERAVGAKASGKSYFTKATMNKLKAHVS